MFLNKLEEKISNASFVAQIMDCLGETDSEFSLEILKLIYNKSNDYIKIEVLKKMMTIQEIDEYFLFNLLDIVDSYKKPFVYDLIIKSPCARERVAKILLSHTNPFGIRTKVILEGLKLIEEKPFKEVKSYLVTLSSYRFYWNSLIRKTAKRILEKIKDE